MSAYFGKTKFEFLKIEIRALENKENFVEERM
jgi:hypothetical protein